MIDIEKNIAAIWRAIAQQNATRLESDHVPRLVAVSKRQPATAIRLAVNAGQLEFGENYVQEAIEKMQELHDDRIIWHFIGAIQSNKTRDIAEHFDWVHSVDRLKTAQRLSSQRPASLPALNICLQINIDADPAKSGIAPSEAIALAQQVRALPNIRLRGLMILPALLGDTAISFRAGHQLFSQMQSAVNLDDFDTLSMGMSGDYLQAVEQGATLLRIGTAIFGPRSS